MNKQGKKKRTLKKLNFSGYKLILKLKPRSNFITVKEIFIYQKDLKHNVLDQQFQHVFKKLLKWIVLLDENSSDSDYQLALDETKKMQKILEDKYKQEVSKKEYRNYYKKLGILEKELQQKMALRNYFARYDLEEERGLSR